MSYKVKINIARVAVVILFLLGWQYLPKIGFLREHVKVFDPTFISSPTEVIKNVRHLLAGSDGLPKVYPYLKNTVISTIWGTAAGLTIGVVLGLIFSGYRVAADIAWPLIVAVNSVPRIALIPLIVLIVGPTATGTAVSAITIVAFIGFFNALEGGRSVPEHLLDNAKLMGASSRQRLWHLRLPYVLTWTIAVVPNAVALGLIAVVTSELLTGSIGMGSLIQQATSNLDAGLTFGVIFLLAVVGVVLTLGTDLLQRRFIKWRL